MFTGLIEEIGTVRRIERGAKGARLTIAANTVLENTKIGDSIATNGVCLTVVALTDDSFSADVMAESLRRSALGSLQSGSPVNLERAMPADGRFGGHIVSGHRRCQPYRGGCDGHRLFGLHHSAHRCTDHPARQKAGRAGQPRMRCDRQIR